MVIEKRDSASAVSVVEASVCAASSPGYDVFIDLSTAGLNRQKLGEHLEALARDAGLSGTASRVTVVVPEDLAPVAGVANLTTITAGSSELSDALHRAIRGAARNDRHLVVVLNLLLPNNEVLCQLIHEFGRDPLFGMVQPRFADASNDHVFPLPGDGNVNGDCPMLTRVGLSLLPDCVITPELLSACIVISRDVVKEINRSNSGLTSIAGELRLLLCQARRRGYRNLVVNRVTLSTHLPRALVYPSPPQTDKDRLRALYPEIARADAWCANLPQRKLESIFARAFGDDVRERRRLLLDCRGMINQHNGTSHGILGLLDGFHAVDSQWQIDVLVSRDVTHFFQLRKRFQRFGLLHHCPDDTYAAAVLLNQPWALSTVAELHRHALLVAFNMLDTISWDILYVCDERLDAVWRFIARFADALFYNSRFTRDRVTTRFPLQPHVAECVAYHSLTLEEQVDLDALQSPARDDILIIGNDYDHKDMRRTLQLLVDAFPYNKIVAIGIEGVVARNVVAMPSGQIEEAALQRLFATARVIVIPSFYEGFGMPVVQCLAYGRTVVVRQSPLWKEIAGQLRMPGQLVEFDSTVSLIEAVGRALAGHPLNPLPQGTALDGRAPLRWQDCAQRMIDTLEKLLPSADGKRWLEREEALRTIDLLHS
ncbi:MAG: glycosyltransferase [Candidatus Korobacteraceae bacterium]